MLRDLLQEIGSHDCGDWIGKFEMYRAGLQEE